MDWHICRFILNYSDIGLTLTLNDFTFDAMVYFAKDENFNRNVLGRQRILEALVMASMITTETFMFRESLCKRIISCI